jgi:hypothetical protein
MINTRTKLSCFAICALALLCLTGCGWQWQRYNNQEYKFSILFPRFWEIEEGNLNTVVMAMAPLRNKKAQFRENINVVVTELPQEMPLSTFFELNKDMLTSKVAALDDLLEGDIYAGFLPGKWLSFEGRMHDLKLKITSAVWIKGKRVYAVSCASEAKDAAKNEQLFNTVLRSLRVQ